MESGKKFIVAILVVLIFGSLSMFAYFFYQQQTSPVSLNSVPTANSSVPQNKTADQKNLTTKTMTKQIDGTERNVVEENVKIFDGTLASFNTTENKLTLKKKDDESEVTILLTPQTEYTKMVMPGNATTENSNPVAKREETILLSDIKAGDPVSVIALIDGDNYLAGRIRLISYEE